MSTADDVTRWIAELGGGDAAAAEGLWDVYFAKLVRYARRRLQDLPRRTFDEEDIALSAMFSFCRGLEEGRFQDLEDRDDLWRLLVTITARKILTFKPSQVLKAGVNRATGEIEAGQRTDEIG